VTSTIDYRLSTIDHRPSTIDHRPSTIDHRPSTIDYWEAHGAERRRGKAGALALA